MTSLRMQVLDKFVSLTSDESSMDSKVTVNEKT